MNNILYDILNDVNEGIVILNEELNISLWNHYMEEITGIAKGKVISKNVYAVLPNLKVNYFIQAVDNALNNGRKMFFSAAMHKELISNKEYLNLKISRLEKDNKKFLLLEFIDVTNQFIQISTLKSHVLELCVVNKELMEKEKIIKKLAYYDNLTGVANRTLFYEIAEKFLNNAKRKNNLLGLMFIDVDKFKSINDTYGHEAGDRILVQVANILKEATRKNDIVARHGGDEFLILLPDVKSFKNFEIIISRIMSNKNKTIDYNGNQIDLSFSIGASVYPYDGNSIDQLITAADKAMYAEKNKDGEGNCLSSCS